MHPIYSWGIFYLAVSSWRTVVHAQDYCVLAESWARQTLSQQGTCAADLSACSPNTVCGECFEAFEENHVICTDGCTYTAEEYMVERDTSGSYGVGYISYDGVYQVPVNSIGLSYTHTFRSGADGSFTYLYRGVDSTTAPGVGPCTFSFNGVACSCEQVYCDANQATFNNRIDCSALEGGAVIDLCVGVVPTTEPLSLLEILFVVPFVACSGADFATSFPAHASSTGGANSGSDNSGGTSPSQSSMGGRVGNSNGTPSPLLFSGDPPPATFPGASVTAPERGGTASAAFAWTVGLLPLVSLVVISGL